MQKKILNKIKIKLFYLIIFLLLTSCSSVPKNTSNACDIFAERYMWYKHALNSSEKYGAPVHVILAFIDKESGFNRWARPPRTKLLKIIPYKRPSSSLGYSQAVNKTWKQYKEDTNNPLALRTRFKDSALFIGWYIEKTRQINKIPRHDAFRQYLNYYLGWGSYAEKTYLRKKNKGVIVLAKRVQKQSNIYKKQLEICKKTLNRNKYIIF